MRWRGEDRLQINEHPFDGSHIRNKLAFDLMKGVSNLPSSRTQLVTLRIDDGAGPVDYGLFTHAEAATEEFLIDRGWNLVRTIEALADPDVPFDDFLARYLD